MMASRQNKKPDPSDLLTLGEVAAWARVNKDTLKGWCDRGWFPAPIKLPSRGLRWTRASVAKHFASLPRREPKPVKVEPQVVQG